MYARVLWGKIKMGMWDEYERYYDQKIISSTEGVKGFRGRRLLRSLENPDEGISISLLETKEDMENYVKSTQRQELARDAEKLYSGEYWVKHFEVNLPTCDLLGVESYRESITNNKEVRMSIVRLIYVTVQPNQVREAVSLWKNHCAPLMIKQPGCLSEKLLECVDAPGEFISYSEWDSQANIDKYRESQAHAEIQKHSRGLQGGRATVKRYEVE